MQMFAKGGMNYIQEQPREQNSLEVKRPSAFFSGTSFMVSKAFVSMCHSFDQDSSVVLESYYYVSRPPKA